MSCVCLCDPLSQCNQFIVEPHLPTQSKQLYQSNSIKAAGVCFNLYWSILHKGTKGYPINGNICHCFLQTLSLSEASARVNPAFDLRIYIQSRRVGHNWGRGLSSTNRWRVDVIDVEHPSQPPQAPPHPPSQQGYRLANSSTCSWCIHDIPLKSSFFAFWHLTLMQ